MQILELTGVASIYHAVQPAPGQFEGRASFTLKGACWGPCEGGASANGIAFQYQGHHDRMAVNFTFDDAPLNDFLDGEFHSGDGWGEFWYGYIEYWVLSLDIRQARVYDDGETFPFDYQWTPTLTLGANWGVPQPTTWALMIFGLAMTGATMRRRPKVRFAGS